MSKENAYQFEMIHMMSALIAEFHMKTEQNNGTHRKQNNTNPSNSDKEKPVVH